MEFLGILKQVNNVKIVATCRSYATETLRTKYRISKDIGIVELFPLSEKQLTDVAKHKKKLKIFIANPKLKRLASLPFYLNIALQVVDSLAENEELSEHEFKRALWELVWIGHDAQYPDELWFDLNVVMQYVIQVSPTVGLVQVMLLEPLKYVDSCNSVRKMEVEENCMRQSLQNLLQIKFNRSCF